MNHSPTPERAEPVVQTVRIIVAILFLLVSASALLWAGISDSSYVKSMAQELTVGIATFSMLHVAISKKRQQQRWVDWAIVLFVGLMLIPSIWYKDEFWRSLMIAFGVSGMLVLLLERYILKALEDENRVFRSALSAVILGIIGLSWISDYRPKSILKEQERRSSEIQRRRNQPSITTVDSQSGDD